MATQEFLTDSMTARVCSMYASRPGNSNEPMLPSYPPQATETKPPLIEGADCWFHDRQEFTSSEVSYCFPRIGRSDHLSIKLWKVSRPIFGAIVARVVCAAGSSELAVASFQPVRVPLSGFSCAGTSAGTSIPFSLPQPRATFLKLKMADYRRFGAILGHMG